MPFDLPWNDLLQDPVMQTWIRIMQWVWAFSLLWIAAMLLRGGFDDINEIITSPYATRSERWQARLQRPVRALALMGAALFGATSFALTIWFQGAVVIVIWWEFFSV